MGYLWAVQHYKPEYFILSPYSKNYTILNWGVRQVNVNFIQDIIFSGSVEVLN